MKVVRLMHWAAACFLCGLVCLATLFPASVGAADVRPWDAAVGGGPTIRAVQRALRDQGYDPGPADGTLNAETVWALKQAQIDRGFEPTGRLDRRTVGALGVNPEERHTEPKTGLQQPGD